MPKIKTKRRIDIFKPTAATKKQVRRAASFVTGRKLSKKAK